MMIPVNATDPANAAIDYTCPMIAYAADKSNDQTAVILLSSAKSFTMLSTAVF